VLLEHGAPVNAREASAGQTPRCRVLWSYGAVLVPPHDADPSITTTAVDVTERWSPDQAAQVPEGGGGSANAPTAAR
jgi:hypothetical protein